MLHFIFNRVDAGCLAESSRDLQVDSHEESANGFEIELN